MIDLSEQGEAHRWGRLAQRHEHLRLRDMVPGLARAVRRSWGIRVCPAGLGWVSHRQSAVACDF